MLSRSERRLVVFLAVTAVLLVASEIWVATTRRHLDRLYHQAEFSWRRTMGAYHVRLDFDELNAVEAADIVHVAARLGLDTSSLLHDMLAFRGNEPTTLENLRAVGDITPYESRHAEFSRWAEQLGRAILAHRTLRAKYGRLAAAIDRYEGLLRDARGCYREASDAYNGDIARFPVTLVARLDRLGPVPSLSRLPGDRGPRGPCPRAP